MCARDPHARGQQRGVPERDIVENPARGEAFVFSHPRRPAFGINVLVALSAMRVDECGAVVNTVPGDENERRIGRRAIQRPDSSVRTKIAPQFGQNATS